MAGDNEPRSIAAEVALLFLNELESRIESNPELPVSSEAILSFAAIRRADASHCDHWRTILTRHQKFEVIDYMLSEPARADADIEPKADRLIRLCIRSGIELFHDPEQRGWASVRIDRHWENYPLRSRPVSALHAPNLL